MHHALLSAFP